MSQSDRKKLGPHSRTFRRGIFSSSIDGRTVTGRFLRHFEAEMTTHCGGNVSTAQRLLIGKLAIDAWRLKLFGEKALSGTFSEHDGRAFHALNNSFRLGLRDLGLEARVTKTVPTLAEIFGSAKDAA